MTDKLQWGILATGRIAGAFAKGLASSRTGKLVAVGSRTQEAAAKFAAEHGGARAHGSYEALLADKEVQAVYISTPHPMHAEWAVKAAEAGKHILCEKPITLNFADASAVIDAAKRHDVFLMEAFMYRCNPQTHKIVELIRSGAIGQVRVIYGSFAFNAGEAKEGARIADPALGGGGILDVGCYPVSMARLVAGVAAGRPFDDPVSVVGTGHLNRLGTDAWASAVLKFDSGIIAHVSTGVEVGQDNVVRIFGSTGELFVPSPWFCTGRDGGTSKLVIRRPGKPDEEITVTESRSLYAVEADTVTQFIEQRQASSPAMSWADTLGNMKALDQWRACIGVKYPEEEPENARFTIARRPLRAPQTPQIPRGSIPHLDKPMARLACGGDWSGGDPLGAFRVFDAYFEAGGNVFDTAYVYYRGKSDHSVGCWVRSRGVRDQVVILAKGAHTPNCYPDAMREQLEQSLNWMGLDSVDIYMLHRDNPDVPVGEFIDALNEQVKLGRFKAFGGSNWSIARVEEANAYARTRGLQGFSAVSNNFSLAEMIDPVWAGCIHNSDAASRAWFTKTQMPLMPWSSQARGFFTDRSGPDLKTDAELVRCWYSPENFRRKERAYELARKYKVEPINIALAYVLSQPFPTFPLIGPRQLSELRSSLAAVDVKLTPEELRYLNLEA